MADGHGGHDGGGDPAGHAPEGEVVDGPAHRAGKRLVDALKLKYGIGGNIFSQFEIMSGVLVIS